MTHATKRLNSNKFLALTDKGNGTQLSVAIGGGYLPIKYIAIKNGSISQLGRRGSREEEKEMSVSSAIDCCLGLMLNEAREEYSS